MWTSRLGMIVLLKRLQHTVFAVDITAAVGYINGGIWGAVVEIMNVRLRCSDPAIVDSRCRRFEAISFHPRWSL